MTNDFLLKSYNPNLALERGTELVPRIRKLQDVFLDSKQPVIVAFAFAFDAIPTLALIFLVTLPAGVWAIRTSAKYFGSPSEFMKSIQGTVVVYTVMLMLIFFALVVGR